MITEDYVSFEIAKLLKEKGFDELCHGYFRKDNPIDLVELAQAANWNDEPFFTSRPTLQMAMKWLVQEHKLYVNVVPSVERYYWTEKWHSYVESLNKRYPFGKFIATFNSSEQAYEAAIKYCLENLV